MLFTRSKKAVENIRQYIIDHYDPTDYPEAPETGTFPEIARVILDTCQREKQYNHYPSTFAMFQDWCQGLPPIFDTCYYYNRSAIKDLGDILEQTKEERERYTEDQAETVLTKLIFREIEKGAKNHV